ncbi:hypothetical protein GCM10007940_24070 [Portibacter lacus]|uniref:Gliding motility lipoprotein GldB n=2 Tax=Portibacter lacus TaxID=1099794 RepID=A0AA37SPJ0_9BACT|nr:hypothetical protein GCM10007940_24070 [Portibacter lacus]
MLLLFSCGTDQEEIPNVSDIDGSFNLYRIEQDIMSADTNNLQEVFLQHPAFMEIYLNNIMGFTQNQEENITGFITDSNINLLYQATQIQYGDFSSLTKDFEEAFQFYKYYFPERDVPDLYTFISEYGIQRFVFSDEDGKDALGIGLDLFLGGDYPYAQFIPNNPAFSQYLIRRFDKTHLVKRSIGALVEDILGENTGNNLLEKMIHNGKKLYILDRLLPTTPDSVIIEYTTDQMSWVEDNQVEMWAYLLKEDLFYESDINKINKLVNPSPNSPGMPNEAPGRTANYLGWKIVDAFMKRQSNYFIQDLVNEKDAQKILNESKFKPRK